MRMFYDLCYATLNVGYLRSKYFKDDFVNRFYIDPDGAVANSSANGLVGTGFASWYRLQHRTGVLKAQ